LSKLSQLKQKAFQAGKDRNWDLAISVYEKILEVEKNNPTVINELGDLCLKSGDSRQAIKHFLSSATKYRKTGLLNNSVAICKKILRHDDANIHAHWYLAEIRSTQDLVVEGETHGLAFLAGVEQVGGEIQEIYLKRCGKLLEVYPASQALMDHLVQIFRMWEMPLDAGRAGCLKACVIYDSGDKESAQKLVDDILVTSPELRNYPEFGKWNKRVNPDTVEAASVTDYNSLTLGDSNEAPGTQTDSPAESKPQVGPVVPAPVETSFAGIASETHEGNAEDAVKGPAAGGDAKDEEGCLVIDSDDNLDMAELIAQATEGVAENAAEEVDPIAVQEPAPEPVSANEPAESVDLLAQILSEDSDSVLGDESTQVDTIAAEIGNMVGGSDSDNDADQLYEMGMVYLEMGLFDKACESFETAAADDDYTIRAHEMWGITLQRAGRPDEAITVLTSGLQFAEEDSRENLGLRYHIGRAHEMADRPETSVGIYEEILAVAPNFLDITRRLSQLAGV